MARATASEKAVLEQERRAYRDGEQVKAFEEIIFLMREILETSGNTSLPLGQRIKSLQTLAREIDASFIDTSLPSPIRMARAALWEYAPALVLLVELRKSLAVLSPAQLKEQDPVAVGMVCAAHCCEMEPSDMRISNDGIRFVDRHLKEALDAE